MKHSLVNLQIIEDIKNLLVASREQLQRSVNSVMVQTYWNIGRIIVEDEQKGENRAEYGTRQLEQISQSLSKEFGKGFEVRNIRNMRQFYLVFPIWHSVNAKLSWTHYKRLIRIENDEARDWYIKESVANNWSVRALDRQVSKLYYERLLSSNARTLVEQEAKEKTDVLQIDPKDILRDPYILDFLNLPYRSSLETDVEQALMDNLQKFLLELGRGFAFVSRQQRLSVEEQDFYIDLVFYNFKLKCFLLIDLKLGKLTHQDVGQMDTYVRIYDKFHKEENDNPTIGLILCSEDSQAVAKYSVLSESKQLFSSKYLPFLPTEEELQRELLRERRLLG
ncbi:MAG: PDDEXK nuclease domain-containing protein [Candidatus Endonucleobacter bathymodioli]|uniref:PDDEXK nuclease domain-containing protein n=1 Tax=Candidatus Endonucleibacter bathymodioli TaxID=539814 RepID=A0AA90NP07_9GAMM|nr:PDDEXK nuclease domain-containing protein [Candidatus Endonucleobacter bathymodioli]